MGADNILCVLSQDYNDHRCFPLGGTPKQAEFHNKVRQTQQCCLMESKLNNGYKTKVLTGINQSEPECLYNYQFNFINSLIPDCECKRNIFAGVTYLSKPESVLKRKEVYYLQPTYGNQNKTFVSLFVPCNLEETTKQGKVIRSLQYPISSIYTMKINYIGTQH